MAAPAVAAFAKGFNAASDTTVATSSALAVSAGDLLIALVTSQEAGTGGQTVTGLTDGTNNFTACTASTAGGGGYAQVWYKENASAVGAAVFTATWSAAVRYKVVTVLRVTGAATSAALLAQSTGAAGGATTVTSGNLVTPRAALLVGVATSTNDRSWAPSAGTETYDSFQTDGVVSHGSFYVGQESGGTYTLSNVASSASNLDLAVAAFSSPAGANIDTEPTAQRVAAGSAASFSVSASGGAAPLSYQWQSNASGSWVNLAGETGTTYTTAALAAGVSYAVRVVVTDGAAIATTSAAAPVWTPPNAVRWPWASVTNTRPAYGGINARIPGSTDASALLDASFFQAPVTTGVSGTVASASVALTASTPAGTQTHAGAVASASVALTASAPAGNQVQVGAVAAASVALAASAPAGALALVGAVAAASVPLTASTPAGAQTHAGVVSPASIASTAAAPAGNQVQQGAVAGAAVAFAAQAPTGTQTHIGAVASAAVAATSSTPAGSQVHNGSVAAATVPLTASTPAGAANGGGSVSPASVAVTASAPAGTQVHQGAVAAASVPLVATAVGGTQVHTGAVAAAGVSVAAGAVAGVQLHQGSVAPAAIGLQAGNVAGTLGAATEPLPMVHARVPPRRRFGNTPRAREWQAANEPRAAAAMPLARNWQAEHPTRNWRAA